ncbi:MAG: hypothetical protein JNK04_10445 [Myxococcales bacterium]|nr:hypothetical protein [Myxococcales bacterium]
MSARMGVWGVSLVVVACSGSGAVKGGPFTGDPANHEYDLDGTKVTLKAGTHQVKTGEGVDDFTATDLTQARLDADYDNDESTDTAVVLTRDAGTVKDHYLAFILANGSTKVQKLGTNVLVENLSLDAKTNGLIVKMLSRDDGVPTDQPPTLPVEKRFRIKDGAIVTGK